MKFTASESNIIDILDTGSEDSQDETTELEMVYTHGDLDKLYHKFSPWLDGLPKIYDEFLEYMNIMDRLYEHVDREKIIAAYLAQHTEFNNVFMDYCTWQEIIKLSQTIPAMHDFFQNILIFFNDAPLIVKQGLLEHCKVWVEHFGDVNFERKIDGVLSKHPSFAAEFEFMNFKDNYINTEQDQEDLNEMIRTFDVYQEIMMLSRLVPELHGLFENMMMYFIDAPLLKHGLLEYCDVWIEHRADDNFRQKIADIRNQYPLFATGYEEFNVYNRIYLNTYATDTSFGNCPYLPIAELNWNAMNRVEEDVPEMEDSEYWEWFKKDPNWPTGSTVVSSKDEFQTKEDEIAEWIEQMKFGGTSGNQPSIELQTYKSNKSESLIGESEGSGNAENSSNNLDEELIEELMEMIMFDGMNGEEFIDYLLSTSEDQQSYCQALELWKNEPKIKHQLRDEDILDESEGYCDEELLDLFLNQSHEARPTEDTYKDIRYIFDVDQNGIPYIANMSEIIPPNFMEWYDEIEKQQEECDVKPADLEISKDNVYSRNDQEQELIDLLMFDGMTGEEFLDYLLSPDEDQPSNCQPKMDENAQGPVKSFIPVQLESKIDMQPKDDEIAEWNEAGSPCEELKKSTIYSWIKRSVRSIFCGCLGHVEEFKDVNDDKVSRAVFYV